MAGYLHVPKAEWDAHWAEISDVVIDVGGTGRKWHPWPYLMREATRLSANRLVKKASIERSARIGHIDATETMLRDFSLASMLSIPNGERSDVGINLLRGWGIATRYRDHLGPGTATADEFLTFFGELGSHLSEISKFKHGNPAYVRCLIESYLRSPGAPLEWHVALLGDEPALWNMGDPNEKFVVTTQLASTGDD